MEWGTVKLPNGHRAIVDVGKLRDYCLGRSHPRGRHKARVFEARLGLTTTHVDLLRDALLHHAEHNDGAVQGRADRFGVRYLLDFDIRGHSGHGRVRSGWRVRGDENFPRFATCYVL